MSSGHEDVRRRDGDGAAREGRHAAPRQRCHPRGRHQGRVQIRQLIGGTRPS